MPAPLGGLEGSVIGDPAKKKKKKKKKRALMPMGQGSGGAMPMGQGSGGAMPMQQHEERHVTGGAMPMMKKGGNVRGCGIAKQGIHKAKMVTMKGA